MRIQPDCLIVVADGCSAKFLKNEGEGARPRLRSLHEMALDNEPSRKLGTDRPGHTQLGASTRKSAYEQTDLHQENERHFLQQVAAKAQALFGEGGCAGFALIAEPRALGVLRQEISARLQDATVLAIAKDYTKTALPELEAILADHPG